MSVEEDEVFPFLEEMSRLSTNYGSIENQEQKNQQDDDPTIREVLLSSDIDPSPANSCDWERYLTIFLIVLFILLFLRVLTHPDVISKLFS